MDGQTVNRLKYALSGNIQYIEHLISDRLKIASTDDSVVVALKTYANPIVNANSTEFEVNNWIVSDFIIETLLPIVGFHPFPLTELMLLVSTMCRQQPDHIFEWGTHIGKASRIFHETSKAFEIDCQIHSIDLPDDIDHEEHPQEMRGQLVRECDNVELIQGDGLDDSLRIIKNLPKDSKILFFIDGDHSYESVKREFGTLIEKVPNAWFLLHDTFYQSEDSNYNIGPHQAIKEIMANKKNYKMIKTETGLPGMTLIYR